MNKKASPLTPRLKKIADLVPKNNCTADIGTDHAYIPIALVEQNICPQAIASDINRGPLNRAEANIKKHNLSEKIQTRLGAGLVTLSPKEAEVIIIAGMGGLLIADILEKSRDVADSAKLLLLQPMTAVSELRRYLTENGFEITGEYLEAEDEKLYNILTVLPNSKSSYTEKELYLGKGLSETSPELFERYYQAVLKKLHRRAEGLKKSCLQKNAEELEEIENTIKILTER